MSVCVKQYLCGSMRVRVTVGELMVYLGELVLCPVVNKSVVLGVHDQIILWAHLGVHVTRSWLPLPLLKFQDGMRMSP